MKELLQQYATASQQVYEAEKKRGELRKRIMEFCPVKAGQVVKHLGDVIEVDKTSFHILYLSHSDPGTFMWHIIGKRRSRGKPYITFNLTENQTVEII